jgi:signal transduction histidine kinase
MFDDTLHLAAWNLNLQQILDLPEALLAEGPSYAEYIRILAERGEFGTDDIEAEPSRRLEEIDQELRLERKPPDGRVIGVRRNSVPDGGFVLIYADITGHKRSEAETHSARDAAEAAYRDMKAAQATQAEKMASLGQLTAGIAHEIKKSAQLRQQFRRAISRVARRIEGNRCSGDQCTRRRKARRGGRNYYDADCQSRKDCRARTPC